MIIDEVLVKRNDPVCKIEPDQMKYPAIKLQTQLFITMLF